LPRDPRLRGSIAVATQDPEAAATEIRRVGGHPGVVQVLLLDTNAREWYGLAAREVEAPPLAGAVR